MKVQAFDFSQYHNKHPVTGSTHIRIRQLMKYWPELTSYRYGDNPDVLIFQKVYCTPDYQFPKHFKGIKILDICDPDWLNGMTGIAETVQAMDAVTCPTETLAKFLQQLTDRPVVVVPDRYDLEDFPLPKEHKNEGRKALWFGYRHNAETLKPAMDLLEKNDIDLLVLSEDDPMPWQWLPRSIGERFRHNHYSYIKHDSDPKQLHKDMQIADFAILPRGVRPIDPFKSNNKTVRAMLCGLPVATTTDEVLRFLEPEERQKYIDEHYEKTKAEYDVRKSIDQYKQLIQEVQNGRVPE